MLGGDYLNAKSRATLIRIGPCDTSGLPAAWGYWDATSLARGDDMFVRVILAAAHRADDGAARAALREYLRVPTALVNAAIRSDPNFIGRDNDLKAVDAAFAEADIVAVCGLGGMGKTALAREYGWRHRQRYAIVWWLSAETESTIIEGMLQLGAVLMPGYDQRPDRRAAAEQVTTTLLAGLERPILLVFDGLDDDQLLQGWRPAANAHALVTSRNAVWDADVRAISLLPLSLADSSRFIRRVSRRADLTASLAKEIAQLLDGLPLALVHAASYLNDQQTVSARDYLERVSTVLAEAPSAAEYPRAVFAMMREAIAQAELQAPGATAILCLSAFLAPTSIPRLLFRQEREVYPPDLVPPLSVTGVSPLDLRSAVESDHRMREALEIMNRVSLVKSARAADTFDVHRLVQAAARDLLADGAAAWIRAAVDVVASAFPIVAFETWASCEELLPHARSVLSASRGAPPTASSARLGNRCADVLVRLAVYAEAEPVLRRALVENEQIYGTASREAAESLTLLGMLLADTNRLPEAEAVLQRALDIEERSCGAEAFETTTVLENLARVLRMTNRLTEAEELYRRELDIDKAYYGEWDPAVAKDMRNLASLLAETDRAADAEELFRTSLEIDTESYGPGDPQTAEAVHGLAQFLGAFKQFAEAEALYSGLVPLCEARYGANHPVVASVLCNFANMLIETNRADEAEPLLERALRIGEATYGPYHPDVAVILTNIAQMHARRGRLADAEQLFRRAYEIDEASYGRMHKAVALDLTFLGRVLFRLNQFAEAESLLRRSLEISRVTYGPNHPDVSNTLDALGRLLTKVKRFDEAQPFIRAALRMDEDGGKSRHFAVARDLNTFGELLVSTGRAVEAESYLQKALHSTEEIYGPDHPKVGDVLKNLALVYERTQRPLEAAAARSRAEATLRLAEPPAEPPAEIRRVDLWDS
nr:tetratricopeptide repeat protein [Candidatus Eremiobacteraeota bacterium]